MSWPHDVLDDLAAEAPVVDLTEQTIRLRERRRRRLVPLVAVAAVVATALFATVAVRLLPQRAPVAPASKPGAVADLPARGVEPVTHAYMTWCKPADRQVPVGCVDGGWRVVTRGGVTYRVARALRGSPRFRGSPTSPLAISADGRKIAYYDDAASTFAVRDLASGTVRLAPTRVRQAWLGTIGHLLLSDDGRFLAFTKDPALEDPAMLFDLQERAMRPLPNGMTPIGLSADGGTITLAEFAPKTRLRTITRLWETSTAGNTTSVDVRGAYVTGALGPDGSSVVALRSVLVAGTRCSRSDGFLASVDRTTGVVGRKVRLRGVSATDNFLSLRGWRSAEEITAVAEPYRCGGLKAGFDAPFRPFTVYTVNVRSGVARKVATYTGQYTYGFVLPGFPGAF